MDQAIPVVFCFDANFVNYAAVATFSAFTNSKSKLKVYWLIPSEAVSVAAPIKKLLTDKGVDITIQIALNQHFSEWKEQGHIKKAAYQRLLIPDAVSVPRIIYLDCDLIVQTDLSELFNIEMKNNVLGGVYDPVGEKYSLMPKLNGDKYINSGVMILKLEALRENNFFGRCTEIYNEFTHGVTFCDQCIINKYSEGQKSLIDSSWNYCFFICNNLELSSSEAVTEFEAAKILHFVGPIKPWSVNCPPHLGDYWWKYAQLLNLPNLQRQPYEVLTVIKNKRGIGKRLTDSINKRILKIKQVAQRLYGK